MQQDEFFRCLDTNQLSEAWAGAKEYFMVHAAEHMYDPFVDELQKVAQWFPNGESRLVWLKDDEQLWHRDVYKSGQAITGLDDSNSADHHGFFCVTNRATSLQALLEAELRTSLLATEADWEFILAEVAESYQDWEWIQLLTHDAIRNFAVWVTGSGGNLFNFIADGEEAAHDAYFQLWQRAFPEAQFVVGWSAAAPLHEVAFCILAVPK